MKLNSNDLICCSEVKCDNWRTTLNEIEIAVSAKISKQISREVSSPVHDILGWLEPLAWFHIWKQTKSYKNL